MATGTTFGDRAFLFRLQTLLIDCGTEVLRNIFDQSLKNQLLSELLANEEKKFKSLQARNIITSAQFENLYPKTGTPLNSKVYDITLIVCLLRNLPYLGFNQTYQWNKLPQPSDLSIEADVHRLQQFRNYFAHMSSTTEFTESSFQKKWNEIEQVLLRLNSALQKPIANFNQTINSFKHSPIDSAAEQNPQTTIDCREVVKCPEVEIQQIRQDVFGSNQKVEDTGQRVKKNVKGMDVAKVSVKATTVS